MSIRSHQEIGKSNVRRGKAYERRVAKLLSDWSGCEFRRRRVEGRDRSTLEIDSASDVIPINSPNFPFSIEAKCGTGFSLHAVLTNPVDCLFGRCWFQANYDAILISEIRNRLILPMLFFKPNKLHDWVAFSSRAVALLQPQPNIPAQVDLGSSIVTIDDLWFAHMRINEYSRVGNVSGNVSHSPKNKRIVNIKLEPVIICCWSVFALNVNPSSICQ